MITCRSCLNSKDSESFYHLRATGAVLQPCKDCYRARDARSAARRAGATAVATVEPISMRSFGFGVEIESVGLGIARAAEIVKGVVGGVVSTFTDCYHRTAYKTTMADGRAWISMEDGSIGDGSYSAEVVSPILQYVDIDMLQSVTRALRAAGAKATDGCGIHVHVGVGHLSIAQVRNVAVLASTHEAALTSALSVVPSRLRWCAAVASSVVAKMARSSTREQLATAWYGFANLHPSKSDQSRYHGVNMNSFFYRGTVEFRWFNGTMHAGKIKAHVQLCLGLVAAGASMSAVPAMTARPADRATIDSLIERIGLVGTEFETARHHLLANFVAGDVAEAA